MIRTLIAVSAVAALVAITSEADAQVVGPPYPGYSVVPYGYGAWANPGSVIRPYSYYAAPYPLPARSYVGYGANDFPFLGRPYGHPYDLWTWPYLSRNPYGVLARYYYPPLG